MSLDYEKLRGAADRHAARLAEEPPWTEAENREWEQQMRELMGEEEKPAVTGHVSLEQIRGRWRLVVHFTVVGEISPENTDFLTMLKALRSRPLRGATYEVRGGGLWATRMDLTALRTFEICNTHRPHWAPDIQSETTIEAWRQVPATQAHLWAQTRRVRGTLLGNGGVSGSPAKMLFVLNDLETRTE